MTESKALKQFYTIIGASLGDPVWEYAHLKNTYDLLISNRDMCETDEQRHAVDLMLRHVKSMLDSFIDAALLFGVQADMKVDSESEWGWDLVGFSDRHHEDKNTTSNMMKVICISNTSFYTGAKLLYLNIGQAYLIDRNSIYMDEDGDTLGIVFESIVDNKQPEGVRPGYVVGNFALKHFKSVI